MVVFGVVAMGLLAGWVVNLAADTLPQECPARGRRYTAIPGPACVLLRTTNSTAVDSRPVSRYLTVLFIAVALAMVTYLRHGWTLEALMVATLAWFFLTVAVIDLEHRRVLNRLLIWACPVILLWIVATDQPGLRLALLGAAVGFGLFLLLAMAWPGGLGMGDVKLAGVIGLATGLSGVFTALVVCFITGGIAALAVLIGARFRRGQTMAYAPYLVLGAWAALFRESELWTLIPTFSP
jgi:prepilin signal peptidase PulO-like enzyme (type II secretory pathway)